MNKTIISIVVVVLVVLGFLILGNGKEDVKNDVPELSQVESVVSKVDTANSVVIKGHKLPQGGLEIEVGTTVVWTNTDNLAGLPYDKHTITSGVVSLTGAKGVAGVVPNSGSGVSDGLYQEGLALNDDFEYTFNETGTYTFYIAEHPGVSGEGLITVIEKEETNEAEVIAMESKSFFYSPNVLRAKVGKAVRLDITSEGQHTFTIDELGVDVATPNGQTTRVEFTPEKAGTYEFYCAVPGHRGAGQVGTLIVE